MTSSRGTRAAWVAAALLFAAPAARADKLTESEVAARAAASSFDVSAQQAELEAAMAEVDRARAAYLPRVELSARYTRLSDPGNDGAGNIVVAPGAPAGPIAPGTQLVNVPLAFESLQNHYNLQASLTVPVSDYFLRVGPNAEARGQAARSVRENLEAIKRQAATDGRIAYWSWVRARLSVTVAEQSVAQAKAHLADAEKQLELGTGSRADVLAVEARLAKSELLLESSKKLRRISEERLRVAIHDRSRAAYQVGDDVNRAPGATPITSLDALVARAQTRRPELRALRAAERAEASGADVERAGYLPRLDLFANAYYSNPNTRAFPQKDEFSTSWDAGAQLTWVVSDIPGAGAGTRSAEARVRAATARRRAVADRIRLEVTEAIGDLREAEVSVKTAARALAAAKESHRVRSELFQHGRATSVELLDAETSLTSARLDAIDARIGARVARARLAYALGDDVVPRAR